MGHKKGATLLSAITLAILEQLLRFLYQEINFWHAVIWTHTFIEV